MRLERADVLGRGAHLRAVDVRGRRLAGVGVLEDELVEELRLVLLVDPTAESKQIVRDAAKATHEIQPFVHDVGQGVYDSKIRGGSLLAANGGVAYPGAPNPTVLPEHWRFDVFAERTMSARTSVKLHVQNLFDKTYYDALYQSAQPFILVAPGRAIYLSAGVKF